MGQTGANSQPHQAHTLVETYTLFELDNRALFVAPAIAHHAFCLGPFILVRGATRKPLAPGDARTPLHVRLV